MKGYFSAGMLPQPEEWEHGDMLPEETSGDFH